MKILSHTRKECIASFSADWLAMREPYDVPRAQSRGSQRGCRFAQWRFFEAYCGSSPQEPARRCALAPRLPAHQIWQLVDNDVGLLARASASVQAAGVTGAAGALDLNRDLEAVLDRPVDLITTSALLDLVSEAWLERLARRLAARSIPVYAALSYDGRIVLDPVDDLDDAVISAVNTHQRTDKGFGPALGPLAAVSAIRQFEALDYSAVQGTSDWLIGPADREIRIEMLANWARAVLDINALSLADTVAWLTRRRNAVTAGQSSIRVGHTDFFVAPAGRSGLWSTDCTTLSCCEEGSE